MSNNNLLTPDIIAAEGLRILENNLVMANKVHRGYESDYGKRVNGFEPGETISIRKPADFTVRSGAVADIQDIVEAKTSITVNTQQGIDFKMTSAERTLDIRDLSDRVIKPAMIQIANAVDLSVMNLYKEVPNWVGTPTPPINSYADFAKAPERLDEYAVPQDGRAAVLSPADYHGFVGSQTALFIQNAASSAYREGKLGMVSGVDTYMSQNVPTHTVGAAATASAVADAAAGSGVLSTTYAAAKDLNYMYLSTDGWDASTLKAGDVIQIGGVYAVNPVTKATLGFLKQFTVLEDTVTAAGDTAIKISPPIYGPTEGAFQNVSAIPVDGTSAITKVGTGGTGYRQNMVFHKNAFALAMVPMELPDGSDKAVRKSKDGLSVRLVPYYDGTNDVNKWRFDILYGVKAIDPRLATRISGST
jgi:hypothetical protein